MDERRDLVDREELRRELELEMSECTDGKIGRGRRFGLQCAIGILNSLGSVECPRGWTRDEVLAELDADPDAVCEWLSTFWGDWRTTDRIDALSWHPEVRRYDVRVVRVAPKPEWVPLTQLVGRTIDGCDEVVHGYETKQTVLTWWPMFGPRDQPFPEGTLNLETGQVAVRPKAAT